MSALESVVNELKAAVAAAGDRFSGSTVAGFEEKLAAERARYDELVSAEAAEDVEQEAELAEARQATDAALAELQEAAEALRGVTESVNQLGTVVEDVEAPVEDVPAEEVPAEAPVEEAEVPAVEEEAADEDVDVAPAVDEGGAESAVPDEAGDEPSDAAPTEEPPVDDVATTDVSDQVAAAEATGTSQVTDTPAPAAPIYGGAPTPDSAAPTDAEGNPVEGPAV